MYHYAQINEQGKVHTVMDSISKLVEIDARDERLNGTTYDAETSQFVGYRITLSVDKPSIVADGVDMAVVTANVLNWDETPSTYAGEVTLDINGESKVITAVEGIAEAEIIATSVGILNVKSVNDFLSNGEVTIVSTEPVPVETTETQPTEQL